MKKRGRIHLRNHIASFLSSKPELECKVFSGPVPGAKRVHGKRDMFFSRLVTGIGKGGRAVAIYPLTYRKEQVPRVICEYLRDIETLGGIVGTAENIGDAWDIVVDDPKRYPRKKKTRLHTFWLNRIKGNENGKSATDSEE